jgi:phosphatidylethanolamine/phosphatidyl-N-methylethanolamine N-methyltransferase
MAFCVKETGWRFLANPAAGEWTPLKNLNTQIRAKLSATTLFLQELVSTPREVGAILPSSKQLATAMASWLPMDSDCWALELGPGTGVVTEALIARGLREDRLIAIEQSPKMADHLRETFPRARIITGDAFQLDKLLEQHAPQAGHIPAVFSSLPLLNFEPHIAEMLAKKIHALLPTGGKFVQYTYDLGKKQPKAAAHFRYLDSKVIWLNVPPARVSAYEKKN